MGRAARGQTLTESALALCCPLYAVMVSSRSTGRPSPGRAEAHAGPGRGASKFHFVTAARSANTLGVEKPTPHRTCRDCLNRVIQFDALHPVADVAAIEHVADVGQRENRELAFKLAQR